jgi:hypothetical protein
MLKTIFTSLLLSLSFLIIAQEEHFRISGILYNDAGELLAFANVMLMQEDVMIDGTQSDIDGRFRFDHVKPGDYILHVKYIGYNDQRHAVTVKKKDVTLDIHMYSQEVLLKPIIYLYPEQETEVSVELNYKGELLYTYPAYPSEGWKGTARPDGTITTAEGKEYYGLFWEGAPFEQLSIGEQGFVVKGEETVAFLETALADLGLNRREAMEFIIFWMPRMQNNPYNLIHFSMEEYETLAELNITPQPETMIRVMMVYQPLASSIDIEPQDLSSLNIERKGFTVVEWGGTELKPHLSKR